ncbi:cupin domain-containing protein [Hymenobacter humi]|uniref:Cupin domain-containing protein n=1 Tax=Hymenobacter humi TaxID=1411620 RepID=A0ABW2UFP8_9BACT
MSLKPGEEIGSEVHETHDQFFRIEGGTGKCVINSRSFAVSAGDAVVAPAGSTHNVINTSTDKPLRLYTLYAPPQHRDGITRATKQEATQNEAPSTAKRRSDAGGLRNLPLPCAGRLAPHAHEIDPMLRQNGN